jgi:hypothetical protein
MAAKVRYRKFGFVLGVVVILSLLMSATAYAQTGDAIVELFRFGGTFVGVKITFPTEISGNFLGMISGKSLNCVTVPPNVVYCIGPFQKGAGPSTLFLIDQDTKETVLQKVVSPPKPQGSGEEQQTVPQPTEPPVEPECPPEECNPQ